MEPSATARLLFAWTRRAGFSLLELLVAIAIVSVIVALMLGVYARAKEEGHRAECLSNLRQLGVAFHIYAVDHEEHFPFPNNSAFGEDGAHRDLSWFCALDKSLCSATNIAKVASEERGLFIKQDPVIKRMKSAWWTNMHTIKMNENLGRFDPSGAETKSWFWRMSDCKEPGRTVLLFDGRGEDEQTDEEPLSIIALRSDGTEGYIARRHRDGANILFVDGHIQYRREKSQSTGTQKGWEVNQTSLIWKPWLP
jgi:prepilin-type N-terminal cleavage/methylation domain-containing protein/prepilin-type processing-associated H-X9-DG protein